MSVYRAAETAENNFLLLAKYVTAQTVIPMVGAGFSKPYGFPVWREFLEKSVTSSAQGAIVSKFLSEGKYEEAAQHLRDTRKEAFVNDIINEFADRKISISGIDSTPVSLLPKLFGGPVITTNYDHVLNTVYFHHGKRFQKQFAGAVAVPEDITTAIGQFQHILLKIHGDADNATRILTKTEYDKLYLSSTDGNIDYKNQMLPAALACAFTKRTILFLGCSLQNDRFLRVLLDVRQKGFLPHDRHFAILSQPDDQRYDDEVNRLAQYGIHPIWYKSGEFNRITEILQRLVNHTRPSPSKSIGPSNPKPNSVLASGKAIRTDPNPKDTAVIADESSLYPPRLIEIPLEIHASQRHDLLKSIRNKIEPPFVNRIPKDESVQHQMRGIWITWNSQQLIVESWPVLMDSSEKPLNRNISIEYRNSKEHSYVYPSSGPDQSGRFDIKVVMGSQLVIHLLDRDPLCKLHVKVEATLRPEGV